MTSTQPQFLIWQNYSLDLEDYREALLEYAPDASDSELERLMYENNSDALADERLNLKIDVGSEIICIADIGRWNGRRSGYKRINSSSIADCLYLSRDCDFGEFYVDPATKDLCCKESHHDGTNHLRYRAFRKGITATQKENLLDAIYSGTVTDDMIAKITKPLGQMIAKVYGWKLPRSNLGDKGVSTS